MQLSPVSTPPADSQATQDAQPTQPTQPTQPMQATQRPPRSYDTDQAGLFATMLPRNPQLKTLLMETDILLDSGYTIGRFDDCDVTLDRNFISGKHCRLYIEPTSNPEKRNLYILDMSTNGTYVNDHVLGRGNCTILLHKDRVGFLQAAGALPSDIALEYSVELVDANKQSNSGYPEELDHELLRVYDFKHEIGAGNFAKVWLAIHKQSGMACACKVINKKKHLFSTGLTKVFEREINIMKQLKHTSIVPLHELHTDKDKIYIFMEYLEGGDLFTYLSDNGSFTESHCRPIFKQICSAVHYLHANGITHRDIKLDNILVKTASSGSILSVKIADFGLARAVGDGDLMRTICGTPSYLAPEIVCRTSASTPYSKSVDMWALGVVLYALHMNSFPFSKLFNNGQPTANSIEAYHKASKLNDANLKFVCLSESLRDLITKMLEVDASKRITIEAAIHHLWMQTGSDGVPGASFEPFELWGKLKIVPPPLLSRSSKLKHDVLWTRQQPPIDLFRERTVLGRSRKSHIQIPDSRISSSHCEILFKDAAIQLHNTGRNALWANGQTVESDQSVALNDPYTFSLCAPGSPNAYDTYSNKSGWQWGYTFFIEIAPRPWKQIWVNGQSATPMVIAGVGISERSKTADNSNVSSITTSIEYGGGNVLLNKVASANMDCAAATTNSATADIISATPLVLSQPPPLILPVQSSHLSNLPFKDANTAFAINGGLHFDLDSDKLATLIGSDAGSEKQKRAIFSVLNSDYPQLLVYDKILTFGRSSTCTVSICDPHISNLHCTIEFDNYQARLTNQSINGTFVNSKRIGSTVDIEKGDEIVLLYDRIDMQDENGEWLGQRQVCDSQGYPIAVGYKVVDLCFANFDSNE
ncbi:kinase-like domain-containing protein [Coemansia spiralis]|nr:kinase-like domain-containing protein [Coemansia spiralis]